MKLISMTVTREDGMLVLREPDGTVTKCTNANMILDYLVATWPIGTEVQWRVGVMTPSEFTEWVG